MKTKTTNTNEPSSLDKNKKVKPKEDIRCFNCDEVGHKSTSCNNKDKGTSVLDVMSSGIRPLIVRKENQRKPKMLKRRRRKVKL